MKKQLEEVRSQLGERRSFIGAAASLVAAALVPKVAQASDPCTDCLVGCWGDCTVFFNGYGGNCLGLGKCIINDGLYYYAGGSVTCECHSVYDCALGECNYGHRCYYEPEGCPYLGTCVMCYSF